MRPYEMVVLLHPDLEIDLEKPQKKIEKLIADQKGKITKTDVWGKRKLAYAINKEDFAIYVYYEIELVPDTLRKLEGMLNITDEVIRYLITHPVPVVEDDSESAEVETEAEAEPKPKRQTKKSSAKAGKED